MAPEVDFVKTNNEGLTFEEWAAAAGVAQYDAQGAFIPYLNRYSPLVPSSWDAGIDPTEFRNADVRLGAVETRRSSTQTLTAVKIANAERDLANSHAVRSEQQLREMMFHVEDIRAALASITHRSLDTRTSDLIRGLRGFEKEPLKMVLYCHHCGYLHVDAGEWATRKHKTHLCAHCHKEWQPFEFATVGIPHQVPKI